MLSFFIYMNFTIRIFNACVYLHGPKTERAANESYRVKSHFPARKILRLGLLSEREREWIYVYYARLLIEPFNLLRYIYELNKYAICGAERALFAFGVVIIIMLEW